MEKLKDEILALCEQFKANLESNVTNGNKAAGLRARKNTLALEKLFKQYRKQSVK